MPSPLIESRIERLTEDVAASLRDALGFPEPFASYIAGCIVTEHHRRAGDKGLWQVRTPRDQRDAAIRAQFNGTNLKEVCRTHGVSKATVYRITRRRHAASESLISP